MKDSSNSYIRARAAFEKIISSSKTPEDPSHAENTLYWLVTLEPKANDLLRLSAFAHDIKTAMPDRLLESSPVAMKRTSKRTVEKVAAWRKKSQ